MLEDDLQSLKQLKIQYEKDLEENFKDGRYLRDILNHINLKINFIETINGEIEECQMIL